MGRFLAIAWLSGGAFAAGCGGPPLLHNSPRPDPAVVAAAAAAVAGAATLADPQGAARRNERERGDTRDPRAVPAAQMPGDVLDRIDEAEARAQRDAGSEP